MEFLHIHHVSTDSDSSSLGARAISAVETDQHLVLAQVRRHWRSSSPVRQSRPLSHPDQQDSRLPVVNPDRFPNVELPPCPSSLYEMNIQTISNHLSPTSVAEELELLLEIGKAKTQASLFVLRDLFGSPPNSDICQILQQFTDQCLCFQVRMLGWTLYAAFPQMPPIHWDFRHIRDLLANIPRTIQSHNMDFSQIFLDDQTSQFVDDVHGRIKVAQTWLSRSPGACFERELGILVDCGNVVAFRPRCSLPIVDWWDELLFDVDPVATPAPSVQEMKLVVAVARALAEPFAGKLGLLSQALLRDYREFGRIFDLKQAASVAWLARETPEEMSAPFAQDFGGEALKQPAFVAQLAWLEARYAMETANSGERLVRDASGMQITFENTLKEVGDDVSKATAVKALMLRLLAYDDRHPQTTDAFIADAFSTLNIPVDETLHSVTDVLGHIFNFTMRSLIS